MVSRIKGKKVVGIKQTLKAIKSGEARVVFIAKDADEAVTAPLINLAAEKQVEVLYVESMKELGKMCGIDVGAATAASLEGLN